VVQQFLDDYRPSLLRLSHAIYGGQKRVRHFCAVLVSFRQLFREDNCSLATGAACVFLLSALI